MRYKLETLFSVIVPLAGLVAGLYLGCSRTSLAIFFAMSLITGLGITVGYHRLFTHNSFRTFAPIRLALGVMGSMALQGPLFTWTNVHRKHHQYSDEGPDPHSPHKPWGGLQGFWHAHIGWMWSECLFGFDKIADLKRNPVDKMVNYTFLFWAILGIIAPGGGSMLAGGTFLEGVVWGGFVRAFFVLHITWSINSVCHIWGSQPFCSRDESRNNLLLMLPSLGEAAHNNHHAFPTSARHGLRWYEIDLSYWFICMLEIFGLVWDVRRPNAAILKKLRDQ